MRPDQLDLLVHLDDPQITPDGSHAVWVSRRAEIAGDRYISEIWRAEIPTGTPRRLTRGPGDSTPRISPDGALLAFLREDDRGRPQLAVLPLDGGDARILSDAHLGVSAFTFSAEGSALHYLARVAEQGRHGTDPEVPPEAEAPRRITGARWMADGLGWDDRPRQLFTVEIPTVDADRGLPVSRRLTSGRSDHLDLADDGAGRIILIRDDLPDDAADARSSLIAIRIEDRVEELLVGRQQNLRMDEVCAADDGRIAVLATSLGESGRDFIAGDTGVWLLGEGAPHRLGDGAEDPAPTLSGPLTAVGAAFHLLGGERGRTQLFRIDRTGARTVLSDGDRVVTGHAAAADRVLITSQTPDSAGRVELLAEGGIVELADASAPLRTSGLVAPRELEITGREGYPVHGWLAVPSGRGPHPTLLMIHGGPHSAYQVGVFDEVQVLVEAGYAVAYANPRGSSGYGRAHGRAVRQRMGTVDFHDVIDFLEGAQAAESSLDPDRVGILGGSYGGYLTAWTIAHDHRFSAAIVERGYLDPVTFTGTSDIGHFFSEEYVGTDPQAIAAQSPMAVVDQVRTPSLVIHSERDFRCPLDQGIRYYAALQRRGVPAELLVFPGEGHELSRSGRPRHRRQRFEAILEWWRRHLPVRPNAGATP